MSIPAFTTGPHHVVVELKAAASEAPAGVLAAAATRSAIPGLALPHGGGLQFRPLFRVGGPLADFAHRVAPAAFARFLRPPSAQPETAALSRFLLANVPRGLDPQPVLDRLRSTDYVESAYYAPAAVPAIWDAPEILDTPATTPNYVPFQGYLGPAPSGVDAIFASTQPGGAGLGVTICDVEGGWTLNHEALCAAGVRLVYGTPTPQPDWLNHGTAVLGEMVAVPNGQGCQGIAFAARGLVASTFPDSYPADAIRAAADALQPGDVLLIELHRPGPRSTDPYSQFGYLPMEFWRAEYVALRYAIEVRGVIVVEAAGNGSQDLDDPLYDPVPGTEPQRRDSGAILVGAGAPAGGLFGPDRSRLDFSNYGDRVDCQGWGYGVVTLGYGDLRNGSPQRQYTAQFSGTSSAAPIVAGVCACVQGHARATGRPDVACATMRDWLRNNGSVQTDGPTGPATQRIGSLPDLRELLAFV